MATIAKNVPDSSDPKADTKARRRTLKVTKAEFEGIRAILENPQPPSEKMIAGWEEYRRQLAEDPNSNW